MGGVAAYGLPAMDGIQKAALALAAYQWRGGICRV